MQLQPRLVRLKQAPQYLGMDKNRFNHEVRPYLIEIPIGRQGVAFDRLDLDAWISHYKHRNGRPAKMIGGLSLWDAKEPRDSSNEGKRGILINKSSENAFEKALAQMI